MLWQPTAGTQLSTASHKSLLKKWRPHCELKNRESTQVNGRLDEVVTSLARSRERVPKNRDSLFKWCQGKIKSRSFAGTDRG